jgi:hypothetical protein
MDWINLAQDREWWRMNRVLNLHVPQNIVKVLE